MPPTAPKAEQHSPKEICLKNICCRAVRKHFAALGSEAVLDLPTPLIKDLLPHLTVCQLEELQPPLNQRGISTYCGWYGVLLELHTPDHIVDLRTEEEAKHKVMKTLFTLVFYGFRNFYTQRNITNLNTPYFLWAAAKCIRHFSLITSILKPLQGLTSDQRPLLDLLEKRITSVGMAQPVDLSEKKSQTALYILHRLLDHGVAKKLSAEVQCPIELAWLLHGRGSQYVNPELRNLMHSKKARCASRAASSSGSTDGASCGTSSSEDQDDRGTPCKRSKLDSVFLEEEEEDPGKAKFTVDPQMLCQAFSPGEGPSAAVAAEPCPRGQIDCLEIRQCASACLRVLNSALPTFFCLRSLTLHSSSTFRDSDVYSLARALRQLSDSCSSSLTELSISVLPYSKLLEILLDASPKVTALHVEIQNVMWIPHVTTEQPAEAHRPELSLEKLTIKVAELQSDLNLFTSVLRRSPRLSTLHIAGMRLPTGSSQSRLLTTLSESSPCLKSLNLKDMKLSDCLPEILNLLRHCTLEELRLNDCRLLERWSDKEQSLRQLVSALKTVPSLHTLSLAQNRLAKNVCVLAELFSGSSPSSVKRLSISSNFIQPAELLEFAERLRKHRPKHQLTLDVRMNPGDRDTKTWNAALDKLRPFCVLLIRGWTSTDTMADHISNM